MSTPQLSYSIEGLVEFLADPGREKTSFTILDLENEKSIDLSVYNNLMPPSLKVGENWIFHMSVNEPTLFKPDTFLSQEL